MAALQRRQGLRFLVQPSPIRTFGDEDYRSAGIGLAEDLDPARLIFAIKEIPVEHLRAGRIYVFFSHVIKGQPYNMPMLQRILDLRCTLVDYERVVDEQNRRRVEHDMLKATGVERAHFSDEQQRICIAVALWNGRDPILKERAFGLTGNQGNRGEDVKEYYGAAVPTHEHISGCR